jgi:hypothetical protein
MIEIMLLEAEKLRFACFFAVKMKQELPNISRK